MPTQVRAADTREMSVADPSRVKLLLLVSASFLVLQVAVTDYGPESGGAAWFWFGIGAALVWVVYRLRSRVARGCLVVTALAGTVMYGLMMMQSAHAVLVAALFLGQALPLLSGPVRRHVQSVHPAL